MRFCMVLTILIVHVCIELSRAACAGTHHNRYRQVRLRELFRVAGF